MKKINLLLTFILSSFIFISCNKDDSDFVVGQESLTIEEISNVNLVNTEGKLISTSTLKTNWEEQMKEEGFFVELNTFEIIETYDENNNKLYFLKTTSKDGTIETGAFLSVEDNNVYKVGQKQCTCTGCPNGCHLEVNGNECTCSGCPEDTSKKCTKTESVIIDTEP
ncbi:hypothetical protein [Hanstruepera flava]|uniref:hypothetical protein n=1 Tax=Hanstruepera flava TaxID=2930218 RepID=UPI002027CC21|nr:hypothetical protein [Hanstruepera flava]